MEKDRVTNLINNLHSLTLEEIKKHLNNDETLILSVIKELLHLNRFNDAINIISEYKTPRESLLKVFIALNEGNFLLKYFDKSITDVVILKKVISELRRRNKIGEALKIALANLSDINIRFQAICLYEKLNEIDKALELTKGYTYNQKIKETAINMYLLKGDKTMALEIFDDSVTDVYIISQIIKIYRERSLFEKGIKLGLKTLKKEENENHIILNSQIVNLLYMKGDYNQVVSLGRKSLNNLIIRNSVIKSLIALNKINEAIDLSRDYLDDEEIRYQAIRCYIIKKNFKKAVSLCKKYDSNRKISELYHLAVRGLKQYSDDDYKLLKLIKSKNISINEFRKSIKDKNELEQLIFMVLAFKTGLYYDDNLIKQISYIVDIKDKNSNDYKVALKLQNNLVNNSTIDIDFYFNLIKEFKTTKYKECNLKNEQTKINRKKKPVQLSN